MAWLFPPIIARGKVRDLPKRGVYHGIRIGWLEIQMSLKCDKSVEFSSDILTHLLLVFFIQLGNRYLAPFSLSATAFKKKIILSWSKFFQRNYHPIDPSRVTARRSKARCDTGTWGLVKAFNQALCSSCSSCMPHTFSVLQKSAMIDNNNANREHTSPGMIFYCS